MLQQSISGSGNNTGSNSFVISNNGAATLVPLRQLSGATNFVSGGTFLAGGPNRIIGSSAGGDLFVTSGSINVASRVHQSNLVTITTGPGAGSQVSWDMAIYMSEFLYRCYVHVYVSSCGLFGRHPKAAFLVQNLVDNNFGDSQPFAVAWMTTTPDLV